jgi:hypothetical protein
VPGFASNPIKVLGPPDHVVGSFKRTDGLTGCASVTGTVTLKMYDAAGNLLTGYNDWLMFNDAAGGIVSGNLVAQFAGRSAAPLACPSTRSATPPTSDSITLGTINNPTQVGAVPIC